MSDPYKHEIMRVFSTAEGKGAAVWRLIGACSELDLNSSYAYLLLCDQFRETCAVAQTGGEGEPPGSDLAGAALCFRKPRSPDTLFVWQIAVRAEARGAGLGLALLDHVTHGEACRDVRFVEAHVAPENHASEALFRKFARLRHAPLVFHDGLSAADFPDAHAGERLVRIGPLGQHGPQGQGELK